jgi:hypothetical protein
MESVRSAVNARDRQRLLADAFRSIVSAVAEKKLGRFFFSESYPFSLMACPLLLKHIR